MPTALITGCSRGLGLEFVRQYAAEGWRVHAGVRRPDLTNDLNAIAATVGDRVAVHQLDVGRHSAIEGLARELRGEAIDVLVNSAAVAGREPQAFGIVDYDDWIEVLRINVMGPLKMAEEFVEHLEASEQKKIVILSSVMGSIQHAPGGYYPYSSSKAAVNMVGRSLAADLAPRGIAVALLNPGWVQTDLGGAGATLTAERSVAGMREVIERLTIEDAGTFLNYDGTPSAW